MRLYIGNLPDWITDPQLYEMALPFGKPQAANIARYLVGGKSKGFGYIDYATREEGRAAIAGLNGKEIDGKRLTVYEATAVRARPWSDKSNRSRR